MIEVISFQSRHLHINPDGSSIWIRGLNTIYTKSKGKIINSKDEEITQEEADSLWEEAIQKQAKYEKNIRTGLLNIISGIPE